MLILIEYVNTLSVLLTVMKLSLPPFVKYSEACGE